MMISKNFITVTALLAASLGACGPTEEQAPLEPTGSEQSSDLVSSGDSGVTRELVTSPNTVPVTRLAPQTAIQSQPGPSGTQFDLIKVAVTGDILTVTLQCSTEGSFQNPSIDLRNVSLIDDATAERISVLKDNAGNWLASDVSGDFMRTGCRSTPGVLWAKFPAPPATSSTVSISLPSVAPFDGVPVTR